MSYSQGVAQFTDLFEPPDEQAADFLSSIGTPGQHVLEVGAGAGATAFSLAEAGHRVTALEPDPEMFAVMLSRLALRPALHERVSPVPAASGFAFDAPFDLVASVAVVHLLEGYAERLAFLRYLSHQAGSAGRVAVNIAIDSPARSPAASRLVGTRLLGNALIEKYSSTHPVQDGWWHTKWRFRVTHAGQLVHEVNRTFRWFPTPPGDAFALVEAAGLCIDQALGGFDGKPFVSGETGSLLVIARPRN